MLPTLCWGEYKLIPSCCAQLNTGSDILEDKTNRMPEKIIYMVLKYEDIQPTCPAPGITRRILAHGGGMMGVEASFQKGAVGEAHRHPHEQVSYILSGCFEYEVEGQKYILHKGDSYYVAPDLLHGAVALEEGVILDIFTPQRTDFL